MAFFAYASLPSIFQVIITEAGWLRDNAHIRFGDCVKLLWYNLLILIINIHTRQCVTCSYGSIFKKWQRINTLTYSLHGSHTYHPETSPTPKFSAFYILYFRTLMYLLTLCTFFLKLTDDD